jgi:hypothetical protein
LLTAGARAAEEKFLVHEWGVMITGGPAAGEPVDLAAPAELYTSLPTFVLRHDQAYKPRRQDLGWDKPIIHLYGAEGLKVTVQVGTPMGKPLAYWPSPRYTEKMGKQIASRKEQMIYSLSEATGMVWSGTLSAKPARPPAGVDPSNWWSAVRNVEGAKWINVGEQSERFIFYEATARQRVGVTAKLAGENLTLTNRDAVGSGKVIVIVNDGASRWMSSIDDIGAGKDFSILKSKLTVQPATDEQILSACSAQWRAMGMTEGETAAIIAAWKPDLLHRVGFIVCARMPEKSYNAMFPLQVTPKPDEVVRVGMVFDVLPGQNDRLAWLPELKKTLVGWGQQLGDADFRKREAASRNFQKLGDLSKPYLMELKESRNPEISRAAGVLIEKLNPPPAQLQDKATEFHRIME